MFDPSDFTGSPLLERARKNVAEEVDAVEARRAAKAQKAKDPKRPAPAPIRGFTTQNAKRPR